MVESIKTTWYPARINGVATARIPSGAVASELANDGKKKTILRDLANTISSLFWTIGPGRYVVVTCVSAICKVFLDVEITDLLWDKVKPNRSFDAARFN